MDERISLVPREGSVSALARLARLERATLCLEGRCSIHLSYRRTRKNGAALV